MEGTSIWLSLCLTASLIKKHTDRNSVWETAMTMVPLYNQWESLLKMIPRLNVLNYPCSYSALFNLHTSRTVCECRWQLTLSHEKKKAALDIKTSSSDFRVCYSPRHKFITSLQYRFCCLVFQFKYFCQISRRSSTACFAPLQPWQFYALSSPFRFSFSLSASILSAFATPDLASLSSHTVTCTCQSCIVRIQHIPLAWQTHAVPWPLTKGAQTILLSVPICLYTQSNRAI